MTYGTYLRLDITVHDGWRAVVRAAAKKLKRAARRDRAQRRQEEEVAEAAPPHGRDPTRICAARRRSFGSGSEAVVEALRAEEATARVPIVVCSGRTGIQDHALALEAGADLFLEKPVRPDKLEAEIRRLLVEKKPA